VHWIETIKSEVFGKVNNTIALHKSITVHFLAAMIEVGYLPLISDSNLYYGLRLDVIGSQDV
jgi:hypothetical protein